MNDGIHNTAIIHPTCRLGDGVSVGAYTVIEKDTQIGDGTHIFEHAHIGAGTVIGKHNTIHMGAVVGNTAQHRHAAEEGSFLQIGDNNVIREYVTIHRSYQAGGKTTLGDGNYLMAFSHVAHDCRIGNNVTLVNQATLGGHVEVEDNAIISAFVAVHQFCRIGRIAIIGGTASITKDIPPYTMVDNNNEFVGSLNWVGLKRAQIPDAAVQEIKKAYRLYYLSGLLKADALKAISEECKSEEARYFAEFIRQSKRGVVPHRDGDSTAEKVTAGE